MSELVQDPQVHADIESDLAEIPFRQPIIDDYDPEIHDQRPGEDYSEWLARDREDRKARKAEDAQIDHEWLVLTEAARRSVIQSPDTRQALKRFSSEPLSEAMPEQALAELAGQDRRIARLARRAGKHLGTVLKLSPVPDELLVPDLRHSPELQTEQQSAESLANARRFNSETYDRVLANIRRKVESNPGVTQAERDLVTRRYRYARDVKLLSLMAELSEQPIGVVNAQEGIISHELASGTKLVMSSEAFAASPDLLDPQKWESRRQLKDRVYIVTVGGKEYIMKERKTPRHTDVKKGGHVEGLTSQQEYETATEFAGLGTIRHGDIELSWEKPLGFVEFPDGYQFCLFESEPGLSTQEPSHQLEREILASPGEYEEEFKSVQARAKEIYEQREDLLQGFYQDEPKVGTKRFAILPSARREKKLDKEWAKAQPEVDELTFQEFAELKAYYMALDARELLKRTMNEQGYVNSDLDGFAFRLPKGKRATLEIVGFDFEYYTKDPQETEAMIQRVREFDESGDGATLFAYGLGGKRRILKAASYGMLENIGMRLPPPKQS